MKDRKLLRTGLIGTAIAALCCFTPVPVILLGAVGLSALVGWLDFVLLPALVVFAGITVYALWRMKRTTMPQLRSTLTCPHCGHRETETMPTDACQFFYDCKGCGAVLRPNAGDCCVYCSYGSVPCPPIQEARKDGVTGNRCCGSEVGA